MTTIAYHNGELAGDTRMTDDGVIVSDSFSKIAASENGWLFAGAGSALAVANFLEWGVEAYKPNGITSDPPFGEYQGIIVKPTGGYFYVQGGQLFPTEVPASQPFAAGSGSAAALGALHAGATAEKAVRAAIKTDIFSGGETQVVRIKRLSVRKGAKNARLRKA